LDSVQNFKAGMETLIVANISVLLFVYLLAAMLYPEKF
jgi:K+-transporting ATPase KdpF subunit